MSKGYCSDAGYTYTLTYRILSSHRAYFKTGTIGAAFCARLIAQGYVDARMRPCLGGFVVTWRKAEVVQ